MSILGEVRITNLHCLQQFPQDKGFTEVIDVECRLSGNAGGKVHIRASLRVIKQDAEGNLEITSEMQNYSFSVRRLTGEFYAHVFPFDTKFFRKVHPAGALVFSGVHSHLMLLQHLLIHLPKAKQPIWVLSEVPKYWLEDDGAMCLDETHRWRSADTIAWLRTHGLHSVPNSIKAEIGDLVYNGARGRASNDPPPGL